MSSKSNLLNELFKDLATGPRQLAGGPKPPAAPLSKDPKGVSNVDSNGASNQANNTNNQQRMRTGSVASSSTATTPPPMSVNRVDSDVSSSAVLAAPTMPSRSHSGTALQVFAKASSYVAKTSAAKALKATTITLVKADPSQVSMGARVASSGKFITYANKAGMVRVIHTESVHTGLLRGHAEPIADMKFCPNQDSLVATVSSDGFAIVWELRHMPETGKVEFREAIRLHTSRPEEPFHGVEWHATNQRVFSLMHGNTISVVMLSSKLWSAQQAAGQEGIPIENARCAYAQFAGNSPGGRVLSASFSADGNTLLAGCADGTVAGLNASSLMEDADSTPLSTLWQLSAGDGLGVSLCRFLNRGDHFLLTAVRGNTLLRLWTWDSGSVKYKPSHELKLADGGPLYSAAVDSTGQYVFVGIPQRNVLLCSKLDTTAVQLEQPVEYELDCPVLSFATRRSAPETEEILCQQTNGIQFFSFSPAADYEQVRRQSPSPVIASPVPTMPGGRSTRERQDSGLMTPDQLQHQQQQQQQQQQQPKAQQQQQQQQQPQQPQQVQQAPQVQQPQHQPQPVMYSQQAMPMHHMQQANGMMYGAGIGNLDEALARHLSALEARQKEVADAQAQTSLAQQKGLLEVLAKSLGEIPENIDDAVKEAFEDEEAAAALADALLVKITPALGSALTEAMDTQSASKFNAVDAVAAKVAQALRKPAQEAFSEAMRVSFIPAFEAGCNNLLTQFQQAAQQLQAATSSNESALAQQLQQVRERQSSMESTLQRIEAMLSASNGRMQQQQQSPSPPHQQQHQQPMQHTPPPQHTPSPNLPYQQHQQHQQHQQGAVRNSATSKPIFGDIMSHVSNGNYEGAFLMALSESDLDLVVATCSLVDPERVFGGDRGRVALSQRVLLALVQQLSVDLTVETPLKLQWMQRGALALDPSDPDVGIHVARVMSDVRSHMEQQRPYIVQPEGTGASPNRSLFEMCLNIVSSRASTQAF